jgi:hypothetical protein
MTGNAATSTPQLTITFTPTIKPSKIATPTHASTNMPTPVPTIAWTPLPTLSAYERDAKIRELLETNGGCELPCWWGITPNKTSMPEALHFLTSLMVEIMQGRSKTIYEGGKEHSSTNFEVYFEIPNVSKRGRILFDVQDNVVIWISIFPPGTQYRYQLHQLLSLLGIPEQIYISAWSSPKVPALDEVPPAILVLDYSHIGVWAAYGYLPDRVGEIISICPQDFGKRTSIFEELLGNIGGRLELFDPTMEYPRAISIEEYAKMVSGNRSVSKLEDVTNMTTETFYNTFIDPNSKACLETPANLWP